MPGPDPVALDPEREVGAQPDGLSAAGRVGGMPIVVDQRPVRRRPAVVEGRLADQVHLDACPSRQRTVRTRRWSASSSAGGRVCGVTASSAVARAHRQRVADHDPARRRLPRRRRGRSCRARRPATVGWLIPNGPEPEVARLAVEQGAEHARRVEAAGRTASRPRRRARPGRRCGSRTGTRSRRSAGTATAPRRSAGDRVAHDAIHGLVPAAVLGRQPVGLRRPPGSRGVRVDRRRRVEQRLHDPPGLLDPVLPGEAGAVARAARRAGAPRTAWRPRRPASANSMSRSIRPTAERVAAPCVQDQPDPGRRVQLDDDLVRFRSAVPCTPKPSRGGRLKMTRSSVWVTGSRLPVRMKNGTPDQRQFSISSRIAA